MEVNQRPPVPITPDKCDIMRESSHLAIPTLAQLVFKPPNMV